MTKLEEIKYETEWLPKEDITAYELALCIPYTMLKLHSCEDWDKLPESITRNFTVKEFKYGNMIRNNAKKMKKMIAELEEDFGKK